MNFLAQKRKKILQQDISPTPSKARTFDNFYYKEIALLTGAGGYGVDLINKTSYIDPEGKKILNITGDFNPTNMLLEFYAEEEKERVMATFTKCSQGTPFTTIVKMKKTTGELFWARVMGKPKYDNKGNIVGIHGVFQDITKEKERETQLQESMRTIASQNSRLFEYANLISHNLKSHASNLNMSLELLGDTKDTSEAKELFSLLKGISNELCETINDLCETVSVTETAKISKTEISFEDAIIASKQRLASKISEQPIQLYTDFSEAPSIQYIPSFLEYIFDTLLLQAMERKHPERSLNIQIFSLESERGSSLLFKDNGIGHSREEDLQKVFDITKTNTAYTTCKNIELFQLKNKIEALGGSVQLDSSPERGSTFTIVF